MTYKCRGVGIPYVCRNHEYDITISSEFDSSKSDRLHVQIRFPRIAICVIEMYLYTCIYINEYYPVDGSTCPKSGVSEQKITGRRRVKRKLLATPHLPNVWCFIPLHKFKSGTCMARFVFVVTGRRLSLCETSVSSLINDIAIRISKLASQVSL